MRTTLVLLVCVFLLAVDASSTKSATTAPSAGCTGKVKLLVPLYIYPGAAWDTVVAGASQVSTVAIINPNSGPIVPPDSSYVSYMNKLNKAGVDMIGYVHTSYGTRSIATVQAEINQYASYYPLLKGIFLDEASPDASHVSYYGTLYNLTKTKPGWSYDIINPGVVPTSNYVTASTQIVSFEDSGAALANAAKPSYASCSNEYHFAAIVNSVSAASMHTIVDSVFNKDYFGYIYVTDGSEACCAYNTLSSYYPSLVSYIASKQ